MFSFLRGVSEIIIDKPDDNGIMQVGLSYPIVEAIDTSEMVTSDIFVCSVSKDGVVSGLENKPKELQSLTEADILNEIVRYANELIPNEAIVIRGDVLSSEKERRESAEQNITPTESSPERIVFAGRQYEYLREIDGYLFEIKSSEEGFVGTYRTFVFPEYAILESHIQGNATYYILFEDGITKEEVDRIVTEAETDEELDINLMELLTSHGYRKYSRAELRDMGMRHERNHPQISKDGNLLSETVISKSMITYYDNLIHNLNTKKIPGQTTA